MNIEKEKQSIKNRADYKFKQIAIEVNRVSSTQVLSSGIRLEKLVSQYRVLVIQYKALDGLTRVK